MKIIKKFLSICGLAVFCLLICGISAAETVGNTADIHLPMGKGIYSAQLGDFITLNAGFDAELINERKFDSSDNVSTGQKLEGVYYMAKLSCTLFDRIQPYITAGISDLEMTWLAGADGAVKIEAGTAGAWGGGLKAYLWKFEGMGLKIFSTASFRITKSDSPRTVIVAGDTNNITEDRFHIYEKQATLGISKEFFIPGYEEASIVPYCGIAWSDTIARVKVVHNTNPINAGVDGNKDNIGLFLGADFIFVDNLSLNIEGRLIDQKSISAGFTALF
jgi:opacity protein-like surface antigen